MDYAKTDAFLCNEIYKRISVATAKEIKDAKALISAAKKFSKQLISRLEKQRLLTLCFVANFVLGRTITKNIWVILILLFVSLLVHCLCLRIWKLE